jgi:hypothetical protein
LEPKPRLGIGGGTKGGCHQLGGLHNVFALEALGFATACTAEVVLDNDVAHSCMSGVGFVSFVLATPWISSVL